MLKEQLLELQRTKKTILISGKRRITFINDENIDIDGLFKLIKILNEFTTSKALDFDRHQLSEREERKFNKKFSPFLKSLITSMNDPQVDILLEFLLRIYSIDTFNQRELQFLLLPFPKYYNQLIHIQPKGNSNISKLRSYSLYEISGLILKDDYLMFDFVQYCSHYSSLFPFVDKVLEIIASTGSKFVDSHVDSFYQIIKSLMESGHQERALSFFERFEALHEFSEIASFFNGQSIAKKSKTVSLSTYEKIFQEKKGRSLLKDQFALSKYLEYCEKCSLIPSEFNLNEFNFLKNVFLKADYVVTDYEDLIALYKETSSNLEMNRYLLDRNASWLSKDFLLSMDRNTFNLELFTDENHCNLIYNLPLDLLEEKSFEILVKCLSLNKFNSRIFVDFVFKSGFPVSSIEKLINDDSIISNDLIKQNFFEFIKVIGYDASNMLISKDISVDTITLLYLLQVDHAFNDEEKLKLINTSIIHKSPLIISSLAGFICKNKLPTEFDLNKFCTWAIDNKHATLLDRIFSELSSEIKSEIHYLFAVQTRSLLSIETLKSRNFNYLTLLYESFQFDFIIQIGKRYGFNEILINHSNTMRMIKDYFISIEDYSLEICKFLIDNIDNTNSLDLLVRYIDLLIQFRSHQYWSTLKIILMEGMKHNYQYQNAYDYLINNFTLFDETDCDLYELVLSNTHNIDISMFKLLPSTLSSATFINIYLDTVSTDVLPIVPFIAPILIDFKMNSIVKLFEKYQNVMISYSKRIITKLPEKSFVLVDLEPRIVLKEICDNFTEGISSTLIEILKTKDCASIEILKKLILCFKHHLSTTLLPSDLVTLIKFYIRSFKDDDLLIMSDFIDFLFESDPFTFYFVSEQTLSTSSSIYCNSALKLIEGVLNKKDLDMNRSFPFLCSFLDFESLFIEDSSKLFKRVYSAKNISSPRLCSRIIRNDPSILSKKIKFLASNLEMRLEVSYTLDVLLSILEDSSIKEKHKSKILPHLLILAEESDKEISSKSYIILELLQN